MHAYCNHPCSTGKFCKLWESSDKRKQICWKSVTEVSNLCVLRSVNHYSYIRERVIGEVCTNNIRSVNHYGYIRERVIGEVCTNNDVTWCFTLSQLLRLYQGEGHGRSMYKQWCNLVFYASQPLRLYQGEGHGRSMYKQWCNLVFYAQSTITVILGRGSWEKHVQTMM